MPAIMPVTDLRNYGEVLREVSPGHPVFLTRNGRGRYAVVDMEDWDLSNAARQLVSELDRGRASADAGTMTFAQAREHLAERSANAEA